MANITLLPSAKVPLVYDGDNTMTTEWYRFFWNIYGFTATGVVPVDKGGTGLDTIGDHQVIIGNSNNVFEPALLSSASIAITYPTGFINLELGTSGVTPGTYGSASTVGVFTVNAYGVLTAASNTSIGIDANQIISGTINSARITGSYTGITGVGTLTVGTWNATTIDTGYGGTGLNSFTSGGALYATSTSALTSGTLPVTAGGTGQTSFINGQLLIGNTTGNTLTKATLTAGSGVTITNGAGSITISATGTGGTVTSVAALTLGTTGTDLSSTVANSTTTPVITLNVPTASASNRGALSAADWTTFNSKAPGVTFTTNYIPYGQGTTTLNQSAGLQFDGTNFTTTGYATATSFRPSSSTIPTNGLYLPAANAIGLATNSTLRMYFTAGGSIGIGNTTVGARVTLSNDYTLGFQNAAGAMTGSSAGAWIVKGTDNNWYFDNFESAMVFRRAGYAETARIFQSGGVSIGNTTDPGATNLSVTGTGKFGTTIGVGDATPSASGAGITFPATQSASTDVHTLDDYEEGTWTATLKGGGADPTTPVTATGVYTKIGRSVTVSVYFDNKNTTGASGEAYIAGLPFTPSASYMGSVRSYQFAFPAGTTSLSCATANGNSNLGIFTSGTNANWGNLQHNAGAGRYLTVTVTYFV